jgi:DNA-binding NarL/FixJ family response regulator
MRWTHARLGMLAEGQSNYQHVTSIMSKLNAGSRTEAVTLGIRQGLIML